MIKPIRPETNSQPFRSTLVPPQQVSIGKKPPETTLESADPKPNPMVDFVSSAIVFLISLIKCLLELMSLPAPEQSLRSISGENSVQTDFPSCHQYDNEFTKRIFTRDGKGKLILRDEQACKLASEIFKILGTNGAWGLKRHEPKIRDMKEQLETRDPHPLETLYFMLHPQNTEHIAQFQKTTASALLKQFNAWKVFINQYSKNFTKEKVVPLIPGFCHFFDLEEEIILDLALREEWEALIEFVFEARKEQLQVS